MLPTSSPLIDAHGRAVHYMRLSITDRCNLHCIYCRGTGIQEHLRHNDILSYEEILRVLHMLHPLGIRKLRLTGGEPLARRGFDALLSMIAGQFPDMDIRITSNGTLMSPIVPLIARSHVGAVNLSIDSFRSATYERLTNHNALSAVLSTLEELLAFGVRVKINAVAMKGGNDGEMEDFMKAIHTYPVDLRFIEFMPMGSGTIWNSSTVWTADEILAEARKFGNLTPQSRHDTDPGPARMFAVEGARGRLGVISAVTCHFCADCNRIRLTSDGNIRTCLFDDTMTPIRHLLRDSHASDAQIISVIREAVAHKPIGAELLAARRTTAVATSKMDRIGG